MFRLLKTEEIARVQPDIYRTLPKIPVVIVLDGVRSLHNVGSVFRTSEAYCVEQLILCGITATPPNAEIHKSALGAEFNVAWSHSNNTIDACQRLRQEGYRLVAVELAEGSTSITNYCFDPAARYALIFGNEVSGVQQAVLDLCEACVELPQFGTKHSLNVSVAAGIAIWETWKQLGSNTEK